MGPWIVSIITFCFFANLVVLSFIPIWLTCFVYSLESVCFAILIGISCDFVIHFSHAYIHFKGFLSRYDRTKYAIIHMGPSILAAAFTTFSAATVMLFCSITSSQKFAMMLIFVILHATIGTFIVFLVLNVTIGPSDPTKFVDSILKRCKGDKGEAKK